MTETTLLGRRLRLFTKNMWTTDNGQTTVTIPPKRELKSKKKKNPILCQPWTHLKRDKQKSLEPPGIQMGPLLYSFFHAVLQVGEVVLIKTLIFHWGALSLGGKREKGVFLLSRELFFLEERGEFLPEICAVSPRGSWRPEGNENLRSGAEMSKKQRTKKTKKTSLWGQKEKKWVFSTCTGNPKVEVPFSIHVCAVSCGPKDAFANYSPVSCKDLPQYDLCETGQCGTSAKPGPRPWVC